MDFFAENQRLTEAEQKSMTADELNGGESSTAGSSVDTGASSQQKASTG